MNAYELTDPPHLTRTPPGTGVRRLPRWCQGKTLMLTNRYCGTRTHQTTPTSPPRYEHECTQQHRQTTSQQGVQRVIQGVGPVVTRAVVRRRPLALLGILGVSSPFEEQGEVLTLELAGVVFHCTQSRRGGPTVANDASQARQVRITTTPPSGARCE